MKKAAIAIGVVAALVAGVMFIPNKTVYLNPEVVELEKVVEVNPLDEQIKKRNEELDSKYRKIQSIEAEVDVVTAEIERLNARKKELQAELATFTIGTR